MIESKATLIRPAASQAAWPEVPLFEFRGLLPKQAAEFLGELNPWETRNVYVLLGSFEEVRALVGTARLLHQYLREGPQCAARGRLTFQEFMDSKEVILRDILALRQKVNVLAEAVSLRLPRPTMNKENHHAPNGYRRVS